MPQAFLSVQGFPRTHVPDIDGYPSGQPSCHWTARMLFGGSVSLCSSAYMTQPACNCLRLFKQATDCVVILALASAGKSMPARTIMIAITTNSSIKVNPLLDRRQRQQRKSGAFIPILSFDRRFEKPHKSGPAERIVCFSICLVNHVICLGGCRWPFRVAFSRCPGAPVCGGSVRHVPRVITNHDTLRKGRIFQQK